MRRLVGAVAVLGMLALAGCGGGEPIPTLPPTPTSTPVFASEEEALAAAEEAYAAYQAMSDLIGSEGGVGPERIAPFVTAERLADEERGFTVLREAGLRTVGQATFEVVDLQLAEQIGEDAQVVFYACVDIGGSRVINAQGSDVTPSDRANRLLLEVIMETRNGQEPLLLASDEQWPSGSC